MIVPLFPLRGIFLYPGAVLPLMIFEPRYRQMVEDLLDTAGRLVIATTVGDQDPGFTLDFLPRVHPVAGLGEIAGHERLPDGRFLIAVYGLDRVQIEELPSDRLYRQVEATPLEERGLAARDEPVVRGRLETLLRERGGEALRIPGDFPTERLIDVLMMQSSATPDEIARVYGLSDIAERAEAALGHFTSP
ncbi:MAG: LON peptidase substrate-binding domain-containing protein [Planctomycetes bacterium]|nr:LON peptidase substrate-binding domain-containing protein [Planctomycetota bacterium]